MRKLIIGFLATTALTLGSSVPALAVTTDGSPGCRGLLEANGRLANDEVTVSSNTNGGNTNGRIPGEAILDLLKKRFECL